tara:strand:- start:4542 stop:4979 length:438 start_codon:yes stop_codon:yes gene_type:complete
MEKMFPFLHEDVLYIINEYAREHTEKKELCSAIFNKYLFMSLVKAKIRYRWIVMIKSFAFKNINEFTNFIEIASHNFHDRIDDYNPIIVNKVLEYYRIPIGPRIKIYYYFIHNHRFNNIYPNYGDESISDMILDAYNVSQTQFLR